MKETKKFISIKQLCDFYNINDVFVKRLEEFELIEVNYVRNEDQWGNLLEEHIKNFESLVRLHLDLNINVEGLHAISQLKARIQELEQELMELKFRKRIVDSNR